MDSEKKKILVIDDKKDIQNLVDRTLKDTEFDIFGMQVFKNIPPFIQKLNKNKAILEKLIFQYDIETINLL